MKQTLIYFLALLFIGVMIGCSDDDDNDDAMTRERLASYTVNMSTSLVLADLSDRIETGTATIEIYNDNTLDFSIEVTDLSSDDVLTAAHIHSGSTLSNGGVVVSLVDGTDITFDGNTASGTVNITDEQRADILDGDVYVNIHSQQQAGGLIRGQIGMDFRFASNVVLSPQNAVPSITDRSESGIAHLRIGEVNKLYYLITVEDLIESDTIVAGHIHLGSSTENGEVIVNLGITPETLGTEQVIELTSLQTLRFFMASYVNIHSQIAPAGLLRGQIVDTE